MTFEADIHTEEPDRGLSEAARILGAIAGAWSTFTLYPNPQGQPAFTRAVDTLATYEGSGMVLEVGAGTFTYQGDEIPGTREGLDRLATQLFIHDVEWIRLNSPPSGQELVTFFQVVSQDRTSDEIGVDELLRDAGVEAIAVRIRGLLGESADGDSDALGYQAGKRLGKGAARRSEIAAMVEDGAEASSVADQLVASCAGDSDLIAKHFVDAFTELYGTDLDAPSPATLQQISEMLMPYLTDEAPSMPIVTFVEAFRHLPDDAQGKVFELFLDEIDDSTHRLFVDQFGGTELGKMAAQLDEDQANALLEYVREAVDQDDGDFADLLPPLRSADDVKETRRTAAERIAGILGDDTQRMNPGAAVFHALDTELDSDDHEEYGLAVLSRLFEVEQRPHRFRRIVRIWTGRIATQVRRRDFTAALRTVRAVQDDPKYQIEDRRMVEDALSRVVTEDLLQALFATTGEEDAQVMELVTALGPGVVDKLIEEMATEENAGRRKVLVELLGDMARENVRPLAKRVNDPRWYVARNLATVLGKSGNPKAAKPLRELTRHDDYRVRVEALRALVPLDPNGAVDVLAAALADGNKRIRQVALTYLKNGRPPIDPLVAIVNSGTLDADVLIAAVDLIAMQKTPEAAAALKEIAGRKFAMRGQDRAVRNAARDALKKMGL